MNRFKVKTWRWLDLTIFKVNKSTIRELKFLQSDLTLNLLQPHVVTYWHDHMQVPNTQTPSFLGFTPTQTALLVTLRSYSKVQQHKLSCLWLQDHPWRLRSSTIVDLVAATSDLLNLMIWEWFLAMTLKEEGAIPFKSHKSTSKVSQKSSKCGSGFLYICGKV